MRTDQRGGVTTHKYGGGQSVRINLTHRMPAMIPAKPAPIHTTLIRRYSSIEKFGAVDSSAEAVMTAGDHRGLHWQLVRAGHYSSQLARSGPDPVHVRLSAGVVNRLRELVSSSLSFSSFSLNVRFILASKLVPFQ